MFWTKFLSLIELRMFSLISTAPSMNIKKRPAVVTGLSVIIITSIIDLFSFENAVKRRIFI